MGAVISLFFLMFRMMLMMMRYSIVLMVWMVQLTIMLFAALFGGGSHVRWPRLRL